MFLFLACSILLSRIRLRTILSGLKPLIIIVLITGSFGYTYPDPTIAEICRTIATGALSAILVILFMLPGMLAALDRWVCGRKGMKEDGAGHDPGMQQL